MTITHPRPLSLTASAARLTSRTYTRRLATPATARQQQAWDMYDLVGELGFLAELLAARLAQARLYVGMIPDDPSETPEPLPDAHPANDILTAFGGSAQTRTQLLTRLAVNLYVPGEAWLVGIPPSLLPSALRRPDSLTVEPVPTAMIPTPFGPEPSLLTGQAIDELDWRVLSVDELRTTLPGSAEVTLILGPTEAEQVTVNPDEIILIRVWRPHPRRAWEASSPTLRSLTILTEIAGATMHVAAQIEDRKSVV